MRRKRNGICAVLLAVLLGLSLAACGGSGDKATGGGDPATTDSTDSTDSTADVAESGGAPVYGGTATVYYPKFYNYFDPSMMDEYQFSFWYETLWVIDWGLNDPDTYNFSAAATPLDYIMGQLADTWDFDAESGDLTVKLRDDVNFQEGEPYNGRAFVANDVVWSYSRLIGLNDIPKIETEMDWVRGSLYMIEGIEAPDEHTVVFKFAEGYRHEVALGTFMNAKVNIAGPEWDGCPQTWEYAKGTGPYVLTEYKQDNSMTFTKNENYYDYDERYPENKLPYIDTINLVYIADSANVLAQAMSGDLDWFGENNKNVLSRSELSQLENAGVGKLYKFLNVSPVGVGLKVSQKPFDDIKVRQAMQKAIDLKTIDKEYFKNTDEVAIPGLWSPALQQWSTMGTWDAELTDSFEYDPEAAKALLEEAGYKDGFEFTLNTDPLVDMDLYTLAADYLSKIGITMNIEPAAEMMEAVQISQDVEDPRQFNTYAGGFPSLALANMMTGDSGMPNGYNHQDQAYYDMLKAMGEAPTEEDQIDIARTLDTYFPQQHWCVYLSGIQPSYDFMAKRVGGSLGEKVYFSQNMRTVWSRLWLNQ
jgi:peptide/nickel transport system substrate-binding protein